MKPVSWCSRARLRVLVTVSAMVVAPSQRCPAQQASGKLTGIWAAEVSFGPQVPGELTGNGDDARREREGEAQREAAAEPFGIIAAAVHRDDMRHAGAPGSPRSVHRPRELVTVRDRDAVTPEERDEPAGAVGRDRPIKVEVLHGRGGAGKLA